jgi:hypothetical protein
LSHHNIDLSANLSAFMFARHGDQKGAHRRVLADEDGQIIAGRGPPKAAKQFGLTRDPGSQSSRRLLMVQTLCLVSASVAYSSCMSGGGVRSDIHSSLFDVCL